MTVGRIHRRCPFSRYNKKMGKNMRAGNLEMTFLRWRFPSNESIPCAQFAFRLRFAGTLARWWGVGGRKKHIHTRGGNVSLSYSQGNPIYIIRKTSVFASRALLFAGRRRFLRYCVTAIRLRESVRFSVEQNKSTPNQFQRLYLWFVTQYQKIVIHVWNFAESTKT